MKNREQILNDHPAELFEQAGIPKPQGELAVHRAGSYIISMAQTREMIKTADPSEIPDLYESLEADAARLARYSHREEQPKTDHKPGLRGRFARRTTGRI